MTPACPYQEFSRYFAFRLDTSTEEPSRPAVTFVPSAKSNPVQPLGRVTEVISHPCLEDGETDRAAAGGRTPQGIPWEQPPLESPAGGEGRPCERGRLRPPAMITGAVPPLVNENQPTGPPNDTFGGALARIDGAVPTVNEFDPAIRPPATPR